METQRKPLSVSQYKTYEQCPYRWYLSKIERAWQRPAAWLPQGTAVHAAIEWWERGGRTAPLEAVQDAFRASYVEEVNAACDVTPNFDYWFKSGPYAGEADLVRRYQIGLGQCEKYLAWANGHPEEVIWVNEDGTPGIELAFDIDLDGTRVRGYIDAIIVNENGELSVRDHKTGNNPGDDFQLGVYGVAITESFGVEVRVGDYWMGRSGKPTYPFDLTDWTRNRVAEKFHELEENIAAERFDPHPDPDRCRFCDVSYGCQYAAS